MNFHVIFHVILTQKKKLKPPFCVPSEMQVEFSISYIDYIYFAPQNRIILQDNHSMKVIKERLYYIRVLKKAKQTRKCKLLEAGFPGNLW